MPDDPTRDEAKTRDNGWHALPVVSCQKRGNRCVFRTRRACRVLHNVHPLPTIPTLPSASTSRASATTTPISPRVGRSVDVPGVFTDVCPERGVEFRDAAVAVADVTLLPSTLTGTAADAVIVVTVVGIASGVAVSASATVATAVACRVAVGVGVNAEYTSVAVAAPAAVGVPVTATTGVADGRAGGTGGTGGRFTRVGALFTGGVAACGGAGATGRGGTGIGSGIERRDDGVTVAGGVLVGGCVGIAAVAIGGVVAGGPRGTIMPCAPPLPAGVFVAAAKDGALPVGVFVAGVKGDALLTGVLVTGAKGDAAGWVGAGFAALTGAISLIHTVVATSKRMAPRVIHRLRARCVYICGRACVCGVGRISPPEGY